MRKGKRFSFCILIAVVGAAVIGLISSLIIKAFGFMFRAWLGIAFYITMILLILALAGGIVYMLVKAYGMPQKQENGRVTRKALCVVGIISVLMAGVAFGLFSLFFGIFAYQPEHVVEKNGQKMVAYVSSFLDVDVTYHRYVNILVCGYPAIGYEWYGSGGYDPFTRDPIPEPKTSKFYNIEE